MKCYKSLQVSNLYSYIELEGHHSKVAGTLKPLSKGKGPNASMIKQGLHELEAIITQAQVFGIRLEVSQGYDFIQLLKHNKIAKHSSIMLTRIRLPAKLLVQCDWYPAHCS